MNRQYIDETNPTISCYHVAFDFLQNTVYKKGNFIVTRRR